MATIESRLILLVRWDRPGRPLYLGLDLGGGEAVHELPSPEQPGRDLAGAMLTGDDVPLGRHAAAGGLLIPQEVFWSFADPLEVGNHIHEHFVDRHEAETYLRHQRRRFEVQLRWWREKVGPEASALRQLLDGWRLDLIPLLDLLDRLANGLPAAEPAPEPPEPMELPDPLPAVDPDAVAAWLSSASGLGRVYGPGFAPRREQADMGREVAAALAQAHPLLIEAGTGVGKTLAYLVPLLAVIAGSETRGVISTHTRALQSQILAQDLPRLQGLLPEVRWALLMGRRNYLCLRQRRSFLTRPVESLEDALKTAALRLWLRATRHGLREELSAHPLLKGELRHLFDAMDPCLPGDCYEGHDCFVQEARRQARAADLLVVNHSLLMHDLSLERTILGEYRYLVVDEAHRLPQVALDSHSLGCGRWRLGEIGDLLGGWGSAGGMPPRLAMLAQGLQGSGTAERKIAAPAEDFGRLVSECRPLFRKWWTALGDDLAPLFSEAGGIPGRVRIRDKASAFSAALPAADRLLEKLAEAALAGSRFAAVAGELEESPAHLMDDLARAGQACQLLERLQRDIIFLLRDPDDRWVTWAEPSTRAGLHALGATLIAAGELLRDYWLGSQLNPVMTSATLAVGEDFTHMLGELGLTRRRPQAVSRTSPSPFDFHRQMLVLTPAHFLGPESAGFGRAVGDVLAALVGDTGRKTMGLFTSYRHLSEAASVLEAAGLPFPGTPSLDGRPVLLQQTSGASAAALAADFRRRRRAVLLGTSSFWEGMDFPGDDLEILVVAKLPFQVPSDPWVQARCDHVAARGENPFLDFMVQDAVLRLKQGCGRLIRRPGDKGVVIILDNRLHTKNYGSTFLASLPVLPRSFGDQQEMLARIREFFLVGAQPGENPGE